MLSINDPLTPWDAAGPQASTRFAGLRTDPMNPTGYVSLPRAPSERWSEERPGVTKGAVRRHKLMSEALSAERTVDVYATPGFQARAEITPVLILFDGEESRNLLKAPLILDNLFAQTRIPPMLAVFLQQQYERREQDLGCSPSMNRFPVSELMPWLRGEYGIPTAPERAIVAGASFGGLAAAYAAIEHPEVLGRVLSQSGSFWWGKADSEPEWLTAELRSRPRRKVMFYLDVGLMETKGGPLSQLETNRRLLQVLRGKGYDVKYREFNGSHAFPCWRAAFPDALVSLLFR
jgi:enterochelin esterase family protein